MRWNLTPSYVAFRPPHLLLFDEDGGRAEVRHASTGKVIEVVEWRGMKPLRLTRAEQGVLAISPNGLVEVVEVCGVLTVLAELTPRPSRCDVLLDDIHAGRLIRSHLCRRYAL
jgi:hypothetical protein